MRETVFSPWYGKRGAAGMRRGTEKEFGTPKKGEKLQASVVGVYTTKRPG